MSAIDSNRVLAARLGWVPRDFGAIAFDSALTAAIAATQQELKVTVDGIAGPATYRAWLQRELQPRLMPRDLKVAGELAMIIAKLLWLDTIIDLPPVGSPTYARCRAAIDELIRTTKGVNWAWLDSYPNGFEWCGTLPAYAWREAGISIPTRQRYFPSTYRLDRWARYLPIDAQDKPTKPATGPWRMIINLDEHSMPSAARFQDGTLPRAGDIVLVGGVNTGYGKHIALMESFDPTSGVCITLEGNGTGLLPNGQRAHGMVRATRRVGLSANAAPTTYFVRRVIRPAPHDIGVV